MLTYEELNKNQKESAEKLVPVDYKSWKYQPIGVEVEFAVKSFSIEEDEV